MISLSNLIEKNHYNYFLGLSHRDCKVKMDHIINMTKLLEIQKSSKINKHWEKQRNYRAILEFLLDLAAIFNQMQPTFKILNCK